jgi:hypothetical protein
VVQIESVSPKKIESFQLGGVQFRPGFGLTCFVTFAAEIDFLESSVWLIGIFALNLN